MQLRNLAGGIDCIFLSIMMIPYQFYINVVWTSCCFFPERGRKTPPFWYRSLHRDSREALFWPSGDGNNMLLWVSFPRFT